MSKEPVQITVEEARALAAQHRQDRLLIVSWSKCGPLNVVHVGVTPEDSQASEALAKFILKALGYESEYSDEVGQGASPVQVPPAAALPEGTITSELAFSQEYHILPTDGVCAHACTCDCWCKPALRNAEDSGGSRVWQHNDAKRPHPMMAGGLMSNAGGWTLFSPAGGRSARPAYGGGLWKGRKLDSPGSQSP